jgi:hemoglobin
MAGLDPAIHAPPPAALISFLDSARRNIHIFYMHILSEQELRLVVEKFYERVRADAELGPLFNDAIEDWDHHLATLTDFWHSVMLTSGRYKGNPMQAHFKHAERITPDMFRRWLGLFIETAERELQPEHAAEIITKAKRIAVSLQWGLNLASPGRQ